ncbi:type I-E CRISPR-associated protein Cse1/CasA [Streptomyces sp. NPDC003691]
MSASPPGDDLFCLATRPWIPVRSLDGVSAVVGLRQLFHDAHRIEGLAVALPPAASGLLRVLCAMAARITGLHRDPADPGPDDSGPDDSGFGSDDAGAGADDEPPLWSDLRYAALQRAEQGFHAEAVDNYLHTYADRLRLHCPERPFLQDPRLAEQSPSRSGVNKLVMARPAGNNQVFFGHFHDADQTALTSADAALHLIAQLYYGPSGQCTPRTVDGERFGNTRAGPLRRAMSYHPVGRSLYESLVLGIPTPGTWPQGRHGTPDACPWERDELPEPRKVPGGPVGPLSALTERYQHAVLLQPGPDGETVVDATITWAFREGRPDYKDPYLIWDETKEGALRPRDAEAERSLWRDLDALVLKQRVGRDGGRGGRRPPILDGLAGGVIPGDVFESLRVFAYGFDQDGQTRDRTYFSGSTPPLLALLEESAEPDGNRLALGVRDARDAAEHTAGRLDMALRRAWQGYTTPFGAGPDDRKKRGGGPWPRTGAAVYWPAAEARFWDSFHARDFSDARVSFARLALAAFDEATRSAAASPRGARARENARGLITSLLGAPGEPPPTS